jgi:hypothetical protein
VAGVGTNIFAGADATATTGAGAPASSLSAATYGPPAAGSVGPFSPRQGHGAGFWLAVAGVVVLVMVRQSLPR